MNDGRVVVDFSKTFLASYLRGEKYGDHLLVDSIREEPMSIADFPGFNSVLLSFEMLCSIIRQDNPSWKTALSNIAGVYVISDRETGYQYVGSAYGGVGLWQRWPADDEVFPFFELRAAAQDLRDGSAFSESNARQQLGSIRTRVWRETKDGLTDA